MLRYKFTKWEYNHELRVGKIWNMEFWRHIFHISSLEVGNPDIFGETVPKFVWVGARVKGKNTAEMKNLI
jgi:hypothetical protein